MPGVHRTFLSSYPDIFVTKVHDLNQINDSQKTNVIRIVGARVGVKIDGAGGKQYQTMG